MRRVSRVVLHPLSIGFVALGICVALLWAPGDAVAKRVRGIRGQQAPAVWAQKWFNVSGKAPKVSDYRGKVVFLFFFQSW